MSKKRIISSAFILVLIPFLLSFTLKDECDNCIIVYGDSRTGHDTHGQAIRAIRKFNPRVVFHTGDLVANGQDLQEWVIFGNITRGLRKNAEFYPVFGNHERGSELLFSEFPYLNNRHWYTRKSLGIKFIALDSQLDLGVGSAQYIWLESELKGAQGLDEPVIVILHYPVFNIGGHSGETDWLQPILVPLFDKYGVIAVFSGHDHNYQRFLYHDVYYIITAGAGAPLYGRKLESPNNQKFVETHNFCVLSVRKNRLVMRAYDLNGKVIDKLLIDLRSKSLQ